jgi:branched-chain amino acid transport system ATP-binding protein
MLILEDVEARYGRLKAIAGINLSVEESEIVAIIGPNGAGKTTTLRTIFGLLQPSKGSVRFQGEPIEKEPFHRRAHRGISFVPEGGRIFSELTVLENLEMGAFIRRGKAGIRDDIEMVFNMFPILKERRAKSAGTLSGGERQMLALGRCLMLRPILALLDEPSLGLGPIVINEVYEKIRKIQQNNVTILIVEQNARKVFQIADRGYVLSEGCIMIEDTCLELMQNEYVQKAFLGE